MQDEEEKQVEEDIENEEPAPDAINLSGDELAESDPLQQSVVLEKWDRDSNMPFTMMKRWFGGSRQEEIALLFKDDLIEMGQGKLTHWYADPMGKLATIILCD